MRRIAAASAALTVGLVGGVTAVQAYATGGGNGDKVSICHRTASDTNPYVFITVASQAAAQAHIGNTAKGHFAKAWKTAGTFRGEAHLPGDAKDDYYATVEADCEDTVVTEPTEPPTTEPTTEPTETPTTEPTEPPTTEPTETPAPSETPTPKPPKPDQPNTVQHPSAPPAAVTPPGEIDAGL